MTSEYRFKIRGMDCAEEIALLKRELGPLVGEENLGFDLINAKLTISAGELPDLAAEVVERVNRTGMQAIPWADHVQRQSSGESLWTRHQRSFMTALSGCAVLVGFTLHAVLDSPRAALMGAGGEHAYPLPAVVAYAIAVLFGGWFIFPKALFALRRFRPDMNLLMTIAALGAMLIGEWFEAATVTFLFAIALVLESWSIGRARRAIGALLELAPATARYLCPHDGDIEEKPVELVPPGVTVLVRPGERIPLDGHITKGATSVNQAPITGESAPVPKEPGDEVFAGTINGEGAFEFKSSRPASDTTLARIIHMVEEAQGRRAKSEQWVEQFARYYTPAMMLLAVLIAVVPPALFGGSWHAWFYESLVILVIACPCALVISTPVSIVAGLSAAARNGVLIKGGVHLETPAKLRVVAMDKTGTLTRGRPEVQQVLPLNGHTEAQLLVRAACLEASSEHPLAAAIQRKAREAGLDFQRADAFQALPGKGAEGRVDGRLYWIGSQKLLQERTPDAVEIHAMAARLEDAGHSIVVVGRDSHVCGLIGIGDEVRPESRGAVATLQRAGLRVVMLTGDNEGTARAIADVCGVDEYSATLLPGQKVDAVKRLAGQYGAIAMIGDGVNDAPAMAAANVAIAMGAMGTDVAIETADIALMSDDLSRLPWLIAHSRRTLRIIQQNIVFALAIKLAFVALALAGLATLWMAIAADMGASLLVIFNGLRLLHTP